MNNNPYAPPSAQVADVQSVAAPLPPFFAVSLFKFLVLNFCTLSFYQIYWFYRHWKRMKERQQSDIMPVWRAIFSVFFCYPCFREVRDAGVERGIESPPPAGFLAAGWIIVTLLSRLPDPYYLVSFAAILLMLPVQAYASRINANVTPDHDPNSRFSGWNWVGVVFGLIMWPLIIIGTFMPVE